MQYINTNQKAGSAPAADAPADKPAEKPAEGGKKKLKMVKSPEEGDAAAADKPAEGDAPADGKKTAAPAANVPAPPQPENEVQFFNKTSEGAAIPKYCERNLKPIEFYGLATKAQKMVTNWHSAAGSAAAAPAAGALPADLPLLTPEQFATFYKVGIINSELN